MMPIFLPSFAWLEIACTLARRRRNAVQDQRLAHLIVTSPCVATVQFEGPLLAQALLSGAQTYLRAADALYVATAAMHAATLISWNREHLQRADAVTPADWLAANRSSS